MCVMMMMTNAGGVSPVDPAPPPPSHHIEKGGMGLAMAVARGRKRWINRQNDAALPTYTPPFMPTTGNIPYSACIHAR